MIVPLFLTELSLRAWFPGMRDLLHDWASFSHWLLLFFAGFIAALRPELRQRIQSLRFVSVAGASLTTLLLFACYWAPHLAHFTPRVLGEVGVLDYGFFCALRMANAWFWLLTCLGFASAHLNRPSNALTYLTKAVYPIFCLHLPLIVFFDYWILPQEWSITIKFVAITSATLIAALLLYEGLIRRSVLLGVVLGLRRRDIV